jgi:hypothetical protein
MAMTLEYQQHGTKMNTRDLLDYIYPTASWDHLDSPRTPLVVDGPVQTLWCRNGDHEWTRQRRGGKLPFHCQAHQDALKHLRAMALEEEQRQRVLAHNRAPVRCDFDFTGLWYNDGQRGARAHLHKVAVTLAAHMMKTLAPYHRAFSEMLEADQCLALIDEAEKGENWFSPYEVWLGARLEEVHIVRYGDGEPYHAQEGYDDIDEPLIDYATVVDRFIEWFTTLDDAQVQTAIDSGFVHHMRASAIYLEGGDSVVND